MALFDVRMIPNELFRIIAPIGTKVAWAGTWRASECFNNFEIWKRVVIDGEELKYSVSNLGRIRSEKGDRIALMRPALTDGYLRTVINQTSISIHILVARAFVPNPFNLPEVNHIYGVKTDNRTSSLEWSTKGDNIRHAWATGLAFRKSGIEARNNKRVAKMLDGKVIEEYYSVKHAADSNGFPACDIGQCARGTTKSSHGFQWKYV